MASSSSRFDDLPKEVLMRCLMTSARGDENVLHGTSFQNFVDAYPNLEESLYEMSPMIKGITYEGNRRSLKRLPMIVNVSHNVKDLDLSFTRVKSLSGIMMHTLITRLNISGTNVVHLDPIRNLTDLKHLDIHYTHVKDLHALGFMSALEHLDCSCTHVHCLDVLRHAPKLEYLNCSRTRVCYLDGLENTAGLKHIDISRTHVNSIQPLSNSLRRCTETFNCSRTCLMSYDLLPLKEAVHLKWLNFSCTYVDDMEFLSNCFCLEHLECQRTFVSDLNGIKNASMLSYLDCSNTRISSIFPLVEVLVHSYIFPFRKSPGSQGSQGSPVSQGSPCIRHLDCSWNSAMNEGTLAYVQYMPCLMLLDISGLKVCMYEYMATTAVPNVIAAEIQLAM